MKNEGENERDVPEKNEIFSLKRKKKIVTSFVEPGPSWYWNNLGHVLIYHTRIKLAKFLMW